MSFRPRGTALAFIAAAVALVLVPATMSAPSSADALDAALGYLEDGADDLGATSADVADVFVTSQYTSDHNGVTHVNFAQRYRGLEVFGGYATVSVDANGGLVFVGGSLVSLGASAGSDDLGAIGAVEAAADGLDLADPSGLKVLSGGGASAEAVVSAGGIADGPISAKLGYQPTKNGLKLAWQVFIDDSSSASLWNATVDAETGELLETADWTIEDDVEELGQALAGLNPPPPPPPPVPARGFALSTITDGSCYRVFDIALESPNDGTRRLVCNPADATASPFGWHDTNGAAGAEFTITRGNNTHTYFDQEPEGSGQMPDVGYDVDGGAGLQFDFPADLNEHPQNYRQAVATNLFFQCNTFHDLLYTRGWNEVAGNFQANNYGRGGTQGDYVRCEAQDGNGTNNANFGTPAESPTSGGTPRMQMFLWPGAANQNQIVVDGGAIGPFNAGWSRFGTAPTVAGTSGAFFNAGNGCTAANYTGNPGGSWIALATGGNSGCQNIVKARTAEAAGAAGIVIFNGTGNDILTGAMNAAVVTIPVASTNAANGNAIIAALPATGTLRKHPSHPGIRDGSFENGIIFHEYGHGMSIRLTGGPAVNCLGGNEQQGEGWSDYIALSSFLDPALDNPQGPRGMGPYALFQPNRGGNGIRPRPYGRDMTIQPTTYDSIRTNGWLTGSLAVPHGIGHAWAAILWDMTWDLVDKHGFAPNIFSPWNTGGNTRAQQYMVDGLKLQGCNPNFVTSRAAIIAAANAAAGGVAGEQKGDACSLWASFSRRGLGFSAAGGGTGRDDGVEAFDTHPLCRAGFTAGAPAAYGTLNNADPGKVITLKFNTGGFQGENPLMPYNSPFSRRVNCTTLAVPSIGTSLTPREYPISAVSPPGTGLKYKQNEGGYVFPWQTDESWLGTCREFVVTRLDGTQHRAFYRFQYPFDGFLATAQNPPVLNQTSATNSITLYWKIGGDRGLDSVTAGFPQSRPIDCTTFAATGAFEPTATPAWTGLHFLSQGRYAYPWQPPTDGSWAGTCREFVLSLKDGTTHNAYFRFS